MPGQQQDPLDRLDAVKQRAARLRAPRDPAPDPNARDPSDASPDMAPVAIVPARTDPSRVLVVAIVGLFQLLALGVIATGFASAGDEYTDIMSTRSFTQEDAWTLLFFAGGPVAVSGFGSWAVATQRPHGRSVTALAIALSVMGMAAAAVQGAPERLEASLALALLGAIVALTVLAITAILNHRARRKQTLAPAA